VTRIPVGDRCFWICLHSTIICMAAPLKPSGAHAMSAFDSLKALTLESLASTTAGRPPRSTSPVANRLPSLVSCARCFAAIPSISSPSRTSLYLSTYFPCADLWLASSLSLSPRTSGHLRSPAGASPSSGPSEPTYFLRDLVDALAAVVRERRVGILEHLNSMQRKYGMRTCKKAVRSASE